MYIKQISVFVENKPGRLAAIAEVLGNNGIDISALSVADTSDFGILRLIVNNPDKAVAALKEAGVTSKVTDVIGVAMEDLPGGLAKILGVISGGGVVIEYMYAFVGKVHGKAMLVMRVDDNKKAYEILEKNGIELLSHENTEHF